MTAPLTPVNTSHPRSLVLASIPTAVGTGIAYLFAVFLIAIATPFAERPARFFFTLAGGAALLIFGPLLLLPELG